MFRPSRYDYLKAIQTNISKVIGCLYIGSQKGNLTL